MMREIKRGDVVKLKPWEDVQICLYNRRTPKGLYVSDAMVRYFGGAYSVAEISDVASDEFDTERGEIFFTLDGCSGWWFSTIMIDDETNAIFNPDAISLSFDDFFSATQNE